MVVKKLPGADSVLMVYDNRDRLVGTQDGVQRGKSPKEWMFIKYDTLNRQILTGTIQSANSRINMQTAVNGYKKLNESRITSSTNHYYTDVAFPNNTFTKTYLTVTYYDDYDIDNNGSANYTYTTDTDFPDNSPFDRLRNKLAVTKVRELDPASSSEVWFTTATFYDKRYRIIQTKTTGIQGGSNLVTNEVNFPGWLVKSKESQTVVQGTTTLTNYVLTRNEYDHQGRLLNTYHKINTGTERNVSNLSYNELGQLLTKKLHVTSGTGLQKTDYTYNIKGWLKKINEPDLSGGEGDFFGAELLYNEGFEALNGTAMNGAAMYNGNISGIKWKNGSSGSTQKGYGFIYDQINRLTTSKYGEGTSYTTNVSRYDENLTYDKNGNIRKLYRNGQISSGVFGNIDSLGYKYPGTGNQVWAIGDIVTDVAGRDDFFDGTNGYSTKEYYYDKNGNIWLDRNKKMKTVYNYLNLPARISDTVNTAYKIEYVYTSAGEKLKQRLSTGTALLYNGNFVYTLDGTANGIVVKYILTQEGRATNSAGTYTYEYFMKDHLGNIRINFKDSSNVAVIIQQSDYYPFGMIHQPQPTTTSDNRYLYNGKELQDESLGGVNLDWYDYGSRFMDPQIGRFMVVDQSAEKFFGISPYAYVANNPISLIDPDGQEPIKPYAGTVEGLLRFMNNIETKIGLTSGRSAHSAMLRMGQSKMTLKGPRPANTAPFNEAGNNRYIYTEKGGWIDIAHFVFYSGRAYTYKQTKSQVQEKLYSDEFSRMTPETQMYYLNQAGLDPVGEAVQEGYMQERFDPKYSKYSYEDLPSDKYGADFGANYFDPNSDLNFGEQVQNYLNNILHATKPENAPNFNSLPNVQSRDKKPSRQNKSTNPVDLNKLEDDF